MVSTIGEPVVLAAVIVCEAGEIEITGVTVTAQVFVCSMPLEGVLLTVIVAEPAPTAFTKPLESTVATFVLLDSQLTLPESTLPTVRV